MTTEQFAYWLQGYSEICGKVPNPTQWLIIQDHLNLVFKKETPDSRHPLREILEKVYIPPQRPEEVRYCTKIEDKVIPFRSCGEAGVNIIGLDKHGDTVYKKNLPLDIPATSC